jgi:hypothetical protein
MQDAKSTINPRSQGSWLRANINISFSCISEENVHQNSKFTFGTNCRVGGDPLHKDNIWNGCTH